MFVLLMLFLWKYIDDLIGKGFEWYIVMELMAYASATNVAMALPLSVLLSSIMTYGSLGENYELVAIKSAGISLTRALYPMVIMVSLLSVGAFFFSDYMLPKANLKYFSLLYDAREQKSANFLPEGVFSNSFPGYTIRVNRKDPDGQTLYDITIYQKDPASGNSSVLKARKGRMYRTPNNKYLVLELEDGIRYEESAPQSGVSFNNRQTLTRFRFKTTQQKLDITGFGGLHRTDEAGFKGAYQMMSLHQLDSALKATQHIIDSTEATNYRAITVYYKYYLVPHKPVKTKTIVPSDGNVLKGQNTNMQLSIMSNALSEARSINDLIRTRNDRYKQIELDLHGASVEYHKKFTLSAACLVLFLIGAPLGAIIRKGGLGLPVVVSVIFFLIYYIIETIGEKYVKAGNASPFIGMWIAIFILTPIGFFLSYKAATDSVLFDADSYKRFFARLFKVKKKI